jgi:hypothetical protein
MGALCQPGQLARAVNDKQLSEEILQGALALAGQRGK